MNKRRIILDFDNCIADSIDAIVKSFNIVDCTDYGDSKSIRKWNMNDLIPRADDKSIEQMFNSHLFWNNLKLYDGVLEFFEKYQDRIIICSIGSIENQVKKLQWIHSKLGRVDMLPVITDMCVHPKSIDKSYIDMSDCIYVDDSLNNLLISNSKFKILYSDRGFDCEWNKCTDEDEFEISSFCENWSKISEYIEFVDNYFANY